MQGRLTGAKPFYVGNDDLGNHGERSVRDATDVGRGNHVWQSYNGIIRRKGFLPENI
jgi:hypothetical protein